MVGARVRVRDLTRDLRRNRGATSHLDNSVSGWGGERYRNRKGRAQEGQKTLRLFPPGLTISFLIDPGEKVSIEMMSNVPVENREPQRQEGKLSM